VAAIAQWLCRFPVRTRLRVRVLLAAPNNKEITKIPTEADLETAAIAPRVTDAGLEALIEHEFYGRASKLFAEEAPNGELMEPDCLKTITVCFLVLKNGFTVIGTSACASPENYKQDLGEAFARADAKRKMWRLEGYALRDRLHAALPA
jgi:Phage protein (N4 Gp49/phage Sf6 gene 66) family